MSIVERSLDEWPSHAQAGAKEATDTTTPTAVKTTAAVWGWLPILTLIHASGLLLITLANLNVLSLNLSSNFISNNFLYWFGLAIMLVPTAIRMISANAARQERVGLVISLGLTLYLVKVIHSPFAFTYGDEFLHLFNTNQILQSQSLFTPNSVLAISPLFPGLPSVTAAITTLTDLSVFQAGLIVIGVARLVLLIALYLFAEEVSRSERIAGLTALIFMCNSNFLYWSAQFAYESLSFPLVVGVLYLIARRERVGRQSTYMAYSMLALLVISAIVVTHHLSSYVMVVFLVGWWVLIRSGIHLYLSNTLNIVNRWRKGAVDSDEMLTKLGSSVEHATASTVADVKPGTSVERGPEGLAFFAFIVALAWLAYVAITTYGYISGIFFRAGLSLFDLVMGNGGGRQLFASTNGYVAPQAEQIITFAGVILSLMGLPFGLYQLWQKCRYNAVAWLLAIGAFSYFGALLLRLTEAGWGTGNRASVYFYLGLAFVLALAADKLWSRQHRMGFRAVGSGLLFALVFMVIFASGVMAGWNPQIRFTQPLVVDAGEAIIEAQGVSAAKWMRQTLGANNRIVTDEANGRLMLAYGEQHGYVGTFPYVYDILRTPTLSQFLLGIMQERELTYAVVDRREVAWDTMAGYFFDPVDAQGNPTTSWSVQAVYEKFDREPFTSRVMDAGNVVIYDIAALVGTSPQKSDNNTVSSQATTIQNERSN